MLGAEAAVRLLPFSRDGVRQLKHAPRTSAPRLLALGDPMLKWRHDAFLAKNRMMMR